MIREMPPSERPRERLQRLGASSLSTAELLAIVLRTGTPSENVLNLAARLLAHYGGLAGLARASFSELCAQHGVGQAKAAQAKAALELGRRLLSSQPQERATVHSPQDVANLLLGEMGLLEQEQLRVILLNTKNQVMDIPEVYRGSVHASLIRVGEVFREAVRQNCPAVIVVHNHPSGDPAPSTEDIEVTEQMVAAGKMLDIEVLDHIVIGQQRYVSLKERGLGFG
ncbi:MAG TPA: JAB domain-containing protein [Dehalococcoidia bacterium]|nr:JAB domain-containing protein [Dehalococcoidia bacterium]